VKRIKEVSKNFGQIVLTEQVLMAEKDTRWRRGLGVE
jgi:hypothetical protein